MLTQACRYRTALLASSPCLSLPHPDLPEPTHLLMSRSSSVNLTLRASSPSSLQACNRQALYCVPLYDSLGDDTVQYILDHSGEPPGSQRHPRTLSQSLSAAGGP